MSKRYKMPASGRPFLFHKESKAASIIEIDAETEHVETRFFELAFPNASSVIVDSRNKCYASKDGVLYSKDFQELVWYPPQKDGVSFDIPENVMIIKSNAICSTQLLYLGGGSRLQDIEANFCGPQCHASLKAYQIQSDNYISVNGVLYDKQMSTLVACPVDTIFDFQVDSLQIIKESALEGNRRLADVVLYDNLRIIENGAFLGSTIKSITGGFGLQTIGVGAFAGCKLLETAIFQEGLLSIGTGAFNNCRNLRELHIPKSVFHIGYDRSFSTISKKTTVYCEKHSYANDFAREHGFAYSTT